MKKQIIRAKKSPRVGSCFLAPLGIGRVIADNNTKANSRSKRFMAAARLSAYEYQAIVAWQGERKPLPRLRYYPERETKRQVIRLCDIQCFHADNVDQKISLPSTLIAKLEAELTVELLREATPLIGTTKKGQLFAASNPIFLAVAQYASPFHKINTRLLVKSPTRQLTFSEAASAAQVYYQPFVENNRQLLAQIAKTNLEAELMSGYSESYCYDLRKNHASQH